MQGSLTDIVIDTRDYTVYRDGYPVTEGHIPFVPKEQDWEHLSKCYKAAYAWGYDWMQSCYCDAFNLGQNCGEVCRTNCYVVPCTFNSPKGDMDDPRGGVRHVIPEKGNYKQKETYGERTVNTSG